MHVRNIALGATAFAGVAAGVTLFGPGLPGAEAEPGVALSDATPLGGGGPALSVSAAVSDDDDDDDSDSDEEDDD